MLGGPQVSSFFDYMIATKIPKSAINATIRALTSPDP
jgi:hypothetical protein